MSIRFTRSDSFLTAPFADHPCWIDPSADLLPYLLLRFPGLPRSLPLQTPKYLERASMAATRLGPRYRLRRHHRECYDTSNSLHSFTYYS
jgi:hypothetical protein